MVFEKEKPEIVIHLAGAMGLRKPANDAAFIADSNFLARTQIILEACAASSVKKIVFISSGGAIYENATQVPTPEDYPAHPTTPYGLANLAIEKEIGAFCESNTLNFIIARLANVYGPGQWQSGFIPAMILKMLKGENPMIFGDGRQTRDFVYIDDAVGAIMMLAEQGKNQMYNVGGGREESLNEIFAEIKNMLGVNVEPVYQAAHSKETLRSALDIAKIAKELGWQPNVGLHDGLEKTIEYYKNAKP